MKPKSTLRHFLCIAGSSLMAISSASAQLYWDGNTTTAGAGNTTALLNRTWGTYAAWNSDSTGGAGGSFSTATLNSDNLFFVAGPSATSGNVNYTVTVDTTRVANSLNFQAPAATTISGGTSITLGDGTAGAGGINMPQFSYGSTAQGAVTINTALILNNSQTWTNNSASALKWVGLNLGTGTLTFSGSGNFDAAAGTISATAGSIIHNGSGLVMLGRAAGALAYTGTTTISGGGTLMIDDSKPAGNFNLSNGILTDYYQTTHAFTSGLGTGDNQIQITGNSGFGGGNGTSTWRIGGTGSTLIWGASGEGSATGFFNPSTLRFFGQGDNMGPSAYGLVTLDNKLNLNGTARTISVAQATGVGSLASSSARIDDGITGSGGLTKTGGGNLIIAGTSDYTDGTSINQGALRFDSIASMPSSGAVQVNDGAILGVRVAGAGYWSGGASGVGTLGGLIAGVGGAGSSTVSYTGNVGLLLDVTANTSSSATIDNAGATSLALHKIGGSSLTLSGNNSYTGGTFLYTATLSANSVNALGTSGNITFRGGTLQYNAATAAVDYGSRVNNSGAAITLDTNSQNVGLSGIANTNTGGLTKSGAGTLTLTGNNSYTGATTINAGTIVLNNDGDVTGSAVTFGASNTGLTVTGGSGVTSIWNAGGGNFGTASNAYSNIQVLIDGAGTAGSAVVTNVNLLIWGRTASSSTITLTNGGQMNVNGEIRIGNPYYSETGGTNMTIGGGTATSTFTGNTGQDFYIGYGERTGSKNNVVTVSSGGVLTSIRDMYVGHVRDVQNNDNDSTNNQLLVSGTGTASMRQLSLGFADADTRDANANVVEVTSGGTLSTTGAIYIGRADNPTTESNANTMTVTGTGSTWNAGNQNVLVGFSNNASAQSNNNILTVGTGGVVSNVSALTVGSGTGTETGNQLVVNGSLTATTVTVSAGNTLKGNGTVTGAVTVNGTVAPGTSTGTLGVTGNTTIAGTLEIEVDGGSFDVLAINGNLDISAATLSILTPGLGATLGSYTIVTYTGTLTPASPPPGFLSEGTLPGGYSIDYSTPGQIKLVSGGAPTGFAAWQTANSTGGALDADHDNDGVDNGTEFFVGGTNNTTGFTALPTVVNAGGTLSVTWPKGSGYNGTYLTHFVVETSDTLTGTWTVETLGGGNITDSPASVKYTFPGGPAYTGKKFARLKVTGP